MVFSASALAVTSDLNTIDSHSYKPRISGELASNETFAQEFQTKYSGTYILNSSKTCTLNKKVKTIIIDVVPNNHDTSVRIKLMGLKDLVDTKFYSIKQARLKSLNSPEKKPNSLLWETADVKMSGDVKKIERMTFSKDVVSFDVERIKGPEGFFDTLFNSRELIGRSRCNFSKVIGSKVLPQGETPTSAAPTR